MSTRVLLAVLTWLLVAAQPALAQPEVQMAWEGCDNPSTGGVWGDNIYASPLDLCTLGVYLTPGADGVSSYCISFSFDEDLQNGHDLDTFTIEPPPGWTDPGTFSAQESDGAQPGRVMDLCADVNGGAPLFGDVEVRVGQFDFGMSQPMDGDELDFRFDDLIVLDDATGTPIPPDDPLTGLPDGYILIGASSDRQGPYHSNPSFNGRWGDYSEIGPPFQRFNTDFTSFDSMTSKEIVNVKAKTGTIGKKVLAEKTRGAILTVNQPGGLGFFQTGVQVPGVDPENPLHIELIIDVSGVDSPNAFTGFELDSPFVPVGQIPPNFLFAGASREPDGTITLFADDSSPQGTPLNLPGDPGVVEFHWEWDGSVIDIMAGPVGQAPVLILDDFPFAFDQSAGTGVGIVGVEKKDKVGVTYEISGNLYDDTRKMILDDFDQLIKIENAAAKDVQDGNTAAAKKKLEKAIMKLEQGDKIKGTDPPQFTGGLIKKVNDWLGGGSDKKVEAARKDIEKRLKKAVKKDQGAIKKIDSGAKATKIQKDIEKGLKEKGSAKAVVQFGVKKEAKGI